MIDVACRYRRSGTTPLPAGGMHIAIHSRTGAVRQPAPAPSPENRPRFPDRRDARTPPSRPRNGAHSAATAITRLRRSTQIQSCRTCYVISEAVAPTCYSPANTTLLTTPPAAQYPLSQLIRRTPHTQPTPIQHVRIDHRRRHIGVPKLLLARPDFIARLEQGRRQ